MPLSQNSWLYNSGLALGAVPTIFGIQLILKPDSAFDFLGFPRPSDAAGQRVAESFCMFMGARDLILGWCTFVAWRSGNRRVLGLTMLGAAGLTVMDGLVQLRQVGEGVWLHWSFTPVGVGLAGALLGWFD